MADIRERLTDLALSHVGDGLTKDFQAYLDLVGPNETPATRQSMGTMSGCALVIRGMWREAGLKHPKLEAPYVVGHAVADLFAIARESGAAFRSDRMPLAGDVVLVGGQPDGGGYEHVFTVTTAPEAWDERGKCRLSSVDGGQKDIHGRQMIAAKERIWQRIGADIWDTTMATAWDGKARPVGRKVRQSIDVSRLPFPDDASYHGRW